VGSAFGQGAALFSNASLGFPCASDAAQMCSVLAISGNSFTGGTGGVAAVGQLSASNTSLSVADFSGIADDNELDVAFLSGPATAFSGTYSIGTNGYGSLTAAPGELGNISLLGVYMTDPTLDLMDPNNVTTGAGGGLVLELDAILAGTTGVLIPQTDTNAAHFVGAYAIGVQDVNNLNEPTCTLCEFDMVAQGSITAGSLSLVGMVSDPFNTLGSQATSSGNIFSGSPLPDPSNLGRYSSFALSATVDNVSSQHFDVVIYQAGSSQLFSVEMDVNGEWLGRLELQGSLSGLPTTQTQAAKIRLKRKR
jgi:hypothetical protein